MGVTEIKELMYAVRTYIDVFNMESSVRCQRLPMGSELRRAEARILRMKTFMFDEDGAWEFPYGSYSTAHYYLNSWNTALGVAMFNSSGNLEPASRPDSRKCPVALLKKASGAANRSLTFYCSAEVLQYGKGSIQIT